MSIYDNNTFIPKVIIDSCDEYCGEWEWQLNHPAFNVDVEQRSITLKKSKRWGVISYGYYLSNNDKYDNNNFTLVLEMTQIDINCTGIGFGSHKFDQFNHDGFNSGNNHSCMVYCDGYFFTSKEFNTRYDSKHGKQLSNRNLFDSRYYGMGIRNKKVTVHIDMKKQLGVIQFPNQTFEVQLPEKAIILVFMGNASKCIIAK